jgi:YHS domain-containing protein
MNSKSIIAIATAVFITGSIVSADSSVASGVPKSYPLKKCVVSGESLGDHGKPVKVSYKGTDVYLCCNDCVADFKKNPAKYVKMVKDAQAKK